MRSFVRHYDDENRALTFFGIAFGGFLSTFATVVTMPSGQPAALAMFGATSIALFALSVFFGHTAWSLRRNRPDIMTLIEGGRSE